MYKCIHCLSSVSSLTQPSAGRTKKLRSTICSSCKNISDPYSLYFLSLPLDVFLFKEEAFNHMAINQTPPGIKYLVLMKCTSILVNSIYSIRKSYSPLYDFFISILLQIAELFLVFFLLRKHQKTQRIFFLSSTFSLVSLIKLFGIFSKTIPNFYFEVVDALVSLMQFKSIFILCGRFSSFFSFFLILILFSSPLLESSKAN
ncbi:hypothetical protein NEFER03_0453 [Nematocida sp. LUAm3]|nr:hypothetical protein NEFER03_0453 [Nematocida sp. LUAm3]KAI5175911.1 hypothetical protein NEFER02_1771 [Nematocida sp. LUAm2]KAI5178707.1 hypothetical protein NEFER01_1826 [Nematocida sp. LUAm1]